MRALGVLALAATVGLIGALAPSAAGAPLGVSAGAPGNALSPPGKSASAPGQAAGKVVEAVAKASSEPSRIEPVQSAASGVAQAASKPAKPASDPGTIASSTARTVETAAGKAASKMTSTVETTTQQATRQIDTTVREATSTLDTTVGTVTSTVDTAAQQVTKTIDTPAREATNVVDRTLAPVGTGTASVQPAPSGDSANSQGLVDVVGDPPPPGGGNPSSGGPATPGGGNPVSGATHGSQRLASSLPASAGPQPSQTHAAASEAPRFSTSVSRARFGASARMPARSAPGTLEPVAPSIDATIADPTYGAGPAGQQTKSPGDAPGLPRAPGAPTIPALGTGFASFSLLLVSMTVLALLFAGFARRSGSARRIDFAGGRPASFALLLERPG